MTFTLDQLRELETFLTSARTVRMRDLATGLCSNGDVAVRHDVDNGLHHALDFARWEHERGILASYYLLPSAEYWQTSVVADAARAIQALGHEVGLHNDAYNVCAGDPDVAIALLRDQAETMRGWGLDVVGSADHGSGAPLNVDLWGVHARRPEEAGLFYEAYLLQRSLGVTYVSDNHGRWRAPLERVPGRPTVVLAHPGHWPLP